MRTTRPAQLEAVTALEPLLAVPAVAAEAWIRTGLVHVTVGDHLAALKAFATARPVRRHHAAEIPVALPRRARARGAESP